MIRLMAFDLDGTLLNEDSLLDPAVIAAVARARAAGIVVTIASGRMFRSSVKFAAQLELGDVPLIVYNGAVIRNAADGRLYREHPLPQDVAQTICRYLASEDVHVNVYHDDVLFVDAQNEITRQYAIKVGAQISVHPGILGALPWAPTKLLAVAEPAHVQRLATGIRGLVGDRVTLASSFPRYLEITDRGVNKGTALAELAAMLGIAQADVLAAGDGQNDLEMVRWAGVGVAAHGAYAELSRVAEVRCAPGSAGLAAVIERAAAGELTSETALREED